MEVTHHGRSPKRFGGLGGGADGVWLLLEGGYVALCVQDVGDEAEGCRGLCCEGAQAGSAQLVLAWRGAATRARHSEQPR